MQDTLDYEGKTYYRTSPGEWIDSKYMRVSSFLNGKLESIFSRDDVEMFLNFPCRIDKVPESLYVKGSIRVHGKNYGVFHIVSEKKEQDLENGILHKDLKISKLILKTYIFKENKFLYNSKEYELRTDSIKFSSKEYEDLLTYFCRNIKEIKELYIYRGSSFTNIETNCIPVQAFIYCDKQDDPVIMNVFYSIVNKKFYMSYVSFSEYSKLYGMLYVKPIPQVLNGGSLSSLNEESILKFYGYDVSEQRDLTEAERQRKLANLMDMRIIRKAMVISYLEFYINLHDGQPKYANAVKKWKKDLLFVNNYRIDKQISVWIQSKNIIPGVR